MALKNKTALLNIGTLLTLQDGTPGHKKVNLPLSSLDREVFVVTDVSLDHSPLQEPAPTAGASIAASINKTSTTIQYISSTDCIAQTQFTIDCGPNGNFLVQRQSFPNESSTGIPSDYLAIIATPDFVVAGSFAAGGGAPDRNVYARVTGYRAVADADTYAALVTEEINS